jgi:hypothetical protein
MADETPNKAPSKTNATPRAAASESCQVAKCKQPMRAKGYCRKHYLAWRRGELGKKQRYNTCSKEGCRKPAVAGGRCAEHKKGGAPAGEAAAAG